MDFPGFGAKASLYKTEKHYHMAATPAALPGVGRAFLAQVELGPEDAADEAGGDCLSACVEAGGSEEECMEECATAEAADEV